MENISETERGKMGRKVAARVWRPTFLENLERTGNITLSAKAAGVSRVTVHNHRKKSPKFDKQVEEAIETAVQILEAEVRRRALTGVKKGIYYKGERVGEQQEYSDTLAMFLLKAHRPEVYRDHVKVEHDGKVKQVHSGAVGLNVKPDLSGLSDAELAELRAIAHARKLEREGEVIETTATEVE